MIMLQLHCTVDSNGNYAALCDLICDDVHVTRPTLFQIIIVSVEIFNQLMELIFA